MAEGGSGYEPSSPDDTSSQSFDSLLLECPICLEQLRRPKSLPCLHSFCQECLDNYISREASGKMASSFSCPVCRKVTEPVNQSEEKERWAEQFPTNNLAVEMIRQLQKTDQSIPCKPCENKGSIDVPAKYWCKIINTYFCGECKINIHDLLHVECEMENVTEFTKSAMIRREASIPGCGKHKEKMEYYCEDHQLLGCNKCIIVDHRKCEEVTSAEDYRDKLVKTSKVDDLLQDLRKCTDAMEILIKDFGEKLHSMKRDHETALKSISDFRKKIDERFDSLQKEITDKLIAFFKEEKENLDISRQKFERLMFAMQNTLTSSKDPALKDDTVGMICLFQRGRAEVESCKELVQELEKSSRSTNLRHEYDPDILAVDTKISLSMGKIVVHQQQRRLPPTAFNTAVPLSERHVKKMGRFNIRVPSDTKDCRAKGVLLLSDGRIVVADRENKKLKLFTENGDFHCEMELLYASYDLCRIGDNHVALMIGNVKTIRVVSVVGLTLNNLSSIQIPDIPEKCLGVTYSNNVFSVGTGKSLYSVMEKGDEATIIHTIESKCFNLSSNDQNGHVFASVSSTTPGDVAVTRLSDGTIADVLKVGAVKGAKGIDVDREGNVYVCGCSSHNVIQMSGEGTDVRELLTSSDGLKYPRAISLFGDKILITNNSQGQRNFVHMFQLV